MSNTNNQNNLYEIKIEDVETKNNGLFGTSGFSFFKQDEADNEFEKFNRDGYKYYVVPHNKEYAVRMINNSDLRVNALLKIDGEVMGRWRINKYSDILIERPAHQNRKFTFVRESSWQADMGGVNKGSDKNGLVEVTFTPEVRTIWTANSRNEDDSDSYYQLNESRSRSSKSNFFDSATPQSANIRSVLPMNNSISTNSYSTGATVLGNDSSQKFSDASYMIEDVSRAVTKRVRLIVSEHRNPYVSIKRDVREYDDPIPPPVRRDTNRPHFTNPNDYRQYDRTFAREFDPNDGYARPSRTNTPNYFGNNRNDSEYHPPVSY